MSKTKLASLLLFLTLLCAIQPQLSPLSTIAHAEAEPVTVVTYTQNVTTLEPFQRKTFYTLNKYWVFYTHAEIRYKTSTDGLTWSDATVVCPGGPDGGVYSIWFDGNYVHYVRSTGIPTESLLYRRGMPNSNGTITWSTPTEQTVITVADPLQLHEPFITVDSEGYPWIGYRWGTNGDRWPNCTKSSLNNGTWQTASGFPYQLSQLSKTNWAVSIVPLTQQKAYAVYLSVGSVRGRLWNGVAFQNEELIASASISGRTRFAHSAVARGDDVYLVFLNISLINEILFYNRTYATGWNTKETVQSSVESTAFPVLSINSTNTDLYCFWANSDTIYYKKRVENSWDTDATTWINEADIREDSLTCSYQTWGSKIAVLWIRGIPYEFDIRFCSLITGTIYKLTLTTTNGGTTNPPPETIDYTEGDLANITAIPNLGYSFDHWQFDGENRTENPLSIQMDTNHTLTAVFIDNTAPEIGSPTQQPAENVEAYQNVTVTVNVTDQGTGVRNVTLHYSLDNATTWNPLNMTAISSDTYQATIPGYGNCTWITYKIIAYDNAENQATDNNTGQYYIYHVIPEYYSTTILPLLTIATLLAVLLHERKRRHSQSLCPKTVKTA